MCEMQKLRASVEQILTAAAEEIFGVFKRSIAEIEEKLSDSPKNNRRNQRPPEAVHQTDIWIPPEQHGRSPHVDQEDPEPPHIKEEQEEEWISQEGEQTMKLTLLSECPTVIPKLWVVNEELPLEQQERSSSLDQVDPEPPHTKEEENLWTNEEGEQLQGLEEADITKFPSTPPHVTQEEQEEEWISQEGEQTMKLTLLSGKLSLSRAEQLLMAIADDSEVEDFSDGEDNDPAVDEVIPKDVDLMNEQPDSSRLDSSGDDSDEEYTPPDAAEDSDSENESQLHHPQLHRHGRKRQHVELGEDEHGHGEHRSEPRNAGRGERWRSAPFSPNLVQFQVGDDDQRIGWQPVDYVEQYIDSELMKLIADCTNSMSLANTGRSLKTSVDEVYHFFGAAILMSCVPYPQMRMFWSNCLQIPAISDIMSRDRFFKLRSHLKVVIDYDVSEDERKTDKFWKVRPFMDRILTGCRLQAHPQCVSIDEQMIPFRGACPFRQYLPRKPNPMGMKNFVLASMDGIVLDFEVYQGSKPLALKVQDSDGLGLGTLVVKRLSETLTAGTQVYCDRFFTTIQAVDHTLKDEIYVTGTVMKGRVKQAMNKLPDDKTLKRQGRGAFATVTRADGKLCVVKRYDNKPVVMLSTVHSEQPEDTCQRWSKKEKKYVTITRPNIVQEYNSKMGGVDMSDKMMSYYRMCMRTKKWTIRMLMHFTDLALVNSWLLYRRDNLEDRTPRKAIMKFHEFRMVVAQVFLSKCDVLHVTEKNENGHLPPPFKKSRIVPIPHISVRSSTAHLPEMVALQNPMRCRAQGCTGKSRVRCMTCNVHLCLQSERNCFAAFHTGQ